MNRKLVAQFLASVDPYTLPTSTFKLEELDEWEIQEIIEQSVEFEHAGHTLYVIPGMFTGGTQTIDCYEFKDNKLVKVNYYPTYSELSDILDRQGWRGDWVPSKDVKKALERIPEE